MDEDVRKRAAEALSYALGEMMRHMRFGAWDKVNEFIKVIRCLTPLVMHEPQFANLQKQILSAIAETE